MRLICLGECMVELAPAENGLFRQGFAGDTFNTAWALRKVCPQDWQIGFATALGDDPLSIEMADFMAENGICTREVQVLSGQTCGLYLIKLVDGERSFAYWRAQSAARQMVDDEDALAHALSKAQAIFLSGISLAILAQDRREALVAALEGYAGQVFFDPNFRARLWHDSGQARDWVLRMARRADILLPSLDDCAALFDVSDAESAVQALSATGVSEIVLTDGAAPVTLWHDGQTSRILAPETPPPLDTTGAGDAFNAGYLAARLQGTAPDESAHHGQLLSARVIATRGGLLDR